MRGIQKTGLTDLTFTSENIARAKKAAQDGPVLITEVGRPGYVLLTLEEYQRLTGNPCAPQTLAEALAMPGGEDIDFDPPRVEGPISRVPDLSD
jgi:hypothetical protein